MRASNGVGIKFRQEAAGAGQAERNHQQVQKAQTGSRQVHTSKGEVRTNSGRGT